MAFVGQKLQAWDTSEMVSGTQNKKSKPTSDDSEGKYCLAFANFQNITFSAHLWVLKLVSMFLF